MRKKASITVEASLICPFFIFAAATLISIIAWFIEAEAIQRTLVNELKTQQYISFLGNNKILTGEDSDIVKNKKNQSVTGRAYVGVTTIGGTGNDEIVYVTPKGNVYHLSESCTYIKNNVYRISGKDIESSRNKSGGKYYQCDMCPENKEMNDVYITMYGTRYHSIKDCQAIKRNCIAVYKKDVNIKKCCVKCVGGM